MLAAYATQLETNNFRLHKEKTYKNRNCFQHDRDRIIHSNAFRRLEYKTQVFVNHEGDHFRTRLTHTLEVSQITRTIAKRLKLNSDLSEVFALAHDLGHPPFGHAGEDALNKAMLKFGGFNHNVQTLKIVSKLEQKYADFDGLNLTYASLEGLAKHNGPIKKLDKSQKYIKDFNKNFDLALKKYPSLEAQIASLADDIAYNNHDIDDGFRAGLINFTDFKHIEIIDQAFAEVKKKYPNLEQHRYLYESLRRVYSRMVDDLVQNTEKLIQKYQITSLKDINNLNKPLAAFSTKMSEQIDLIRKLLFKKIYFSAPINNMTNKAKRIVTDLFTFYMNHPECLDDKLQERLGKETDNAEIICDYIAGMTDRFAIRKHREIFDLYREDRYF